MTLSEGAAIPWDDYRCPLGFLSGKRSPKESSGNAVLFSAHERLLRIALGDWDEFKQGQLVERVIKHLEIGPGFIKRPAPFSRDTESMDNYVGYASISETFARLALSHGQLHYYRPLPFVKFRYQYSIDRNERDVRSWLGRYPTLIAHMKFSAGEMPNPVELAFWDASVAFSGDGTAQDPWLLNWHLVTAARQARPAQVYWRRLAHHWPGGLASVFGEYLDDYRHPIVLACEKLRLGKAPLAT